MASYLKKAPERPEQDLRAVSDLVKEVLDRVRLEGEAAVRYYSKKFDGWDPPKFRVSKGPARGFELCVHHLQGRGDLKENFGSLFNGYVGEAVISMAPDEDVLYLPAGREKSPQY